MQGGKSSLLMMWDSGFVPLLNSNLNFLALAQGPTVLLHGMVGCLDLQHSLQPSVPSA